MTRRLLLLFAASLVVTACNRPSADRTAPPAEAATTTAKTDDADGAFWAWFAGRAAVLRTMPLDAARQEIGERLAVAAPRLQAELADDEIRTLVITADGARGAFPTVERIVARAPSVPGWRVVAFRQPSPIAGETIEIDEVAVPLDDIRFVATPAGPVLELAMYVPGYAPGNDTVGLIGFIALDHALGEYAVETRIGGIEWHPATAAPATARPLAELAAVVASTFPDAPR
jgi:hypothetical protein